MDKTSFSRVGVGWSAGINKSRLWHLALEEIPH
jgi:hypothetical protein